MVISFRNTLNACALMHIQNISFTEYQYLNFYLFFISKSSDSWRARTTSKECGVSKYKLTKPTSSSTDSIFEVTISCQCRADVKECSKSKLLVAQYFKTFSVSCEKLCFTVYQKGCENQRFTAYWKIKNKLLLLVVLNCWVC